MNQPAPDVTRLPDDFWSAANAAAAPPPPRREAIERARLIDKLNGARADCVLVVAPAGFGKTTLLSQWARSDAREQAWITLDERHDDPVLLIGLIASALTGAEALGEDVLAPLNGPAPDVARVVVPRLCDALRERNTSVALILDDLHNLTSPDALACVAGLAERFPDGSRLLMASRSEPEIGIGRLRANGRLDDVRAGSMAMTRGEAAEAFGAVGQNLSAELLGRLVELTEGWPAALYLATIALGGEEDPAAVVERFGGDEREVADYLRAEFLARLDPDDREFLIHASLLDRLSGGKCDAALQRSDSGQVLRRLSRANLLLSPLDTKDAEFRMHALLREMLRAELGRTDPGAEAGIHRRASEWYRENGQVDESVDHAIATGDASFAGARIWSVSATYVAQGRRATLAAWAASFSGDEIASIPWLSMIVAIGALTDGDGEAMQAWVESARARMDGSGEFADGSLAATAEVFALVREGELGLIEIAARYDELFAEFPERSPWRSFCRFTAGTMLHLVGQHADARLRLEEGVRVGAAVAPAVQTVCHAQLCLLAIDQGRVSDAEAQAREGLSRIELFGLEDYAASAMPYGVAALVRALRGDPAAMHPLSVAEQLIDTNPTINTWYGAQARATVARARLAVGDLDVARRRLAEAQASCDQVPEAVVLQDWIGEAREVLDSGSALDERWPLTPAELRLLHRLPTHLTFPEIADQLIVSTNTVKTQARSIYRKLGVSSRSEAVACAQTAGLIDPGDARSPRSG